MPRCIECKAPFRCNHNVDDYCEEEFEPNCYCPECFATYNGEDWRDVDCWIGIENPYLVWKQKIERK